MMTLGASQFTNSGIASLAPFTTKTAVTTAMKLANQFSPFLKIKKRKVC